MDLHSDGKLRSPLQIKNNGVSQIVDELGLHQEICNHVEFGIGTLYESSRWVIAMKGNASWRLPKYGRGM